MQTKIKSFLASKQLSPNSEKSYTYDLEQFVAFVGEQVTKEKLALYQQSLSDLKVSARKRKVSAINQFLAFLYETEVLDRYFKLKVTDKLPTPKNQTELVDLSSFYEPCQNKVGQLMALLILELGLTPAEIAELAVKNIDTNFAIIRLSKAGMVRILQVPTKLLSLLEEALSGQETYLFEHDGRSYSRQWFFNQLKAFLAEKGQDEMTAQRLREQYILREKAAGKSIMKVSRQLGLKSPITLEKFYK